MAGNEKPSVSSLPTVCEVEEVLIGLLNNNTVDVESDDQTYDYDLKTAKLLSSWMCDPQRTPEEIYELIGPKFEKFQGGSENKLTQSFLAAVILDALGVISEREKIVLTGYWANIAWCMIKYLYDNDRGENVGEFIFNPRNLHGKESSWILSACNTDICPDHALRLELFGLIWAMNYLYEFCTKQMVEFFVRTISELDCNIIYNNHAHDLLYSAEDLWVCFDKFDTLDRVPPLKELTDIGHKITDSLLYYEYSREVKFLQNILKLTGILAQIARFRFQSQSRLLRKWLNDCLTLFIHKFRKFFKDGMEKFAQICLHPFIYPYYIDLVDSITSSILDLSGKLNKWRKNKKLTRYRQEKFRRLETRRNYMVYCVDSMSPQTNFPPLLLKQELGMLKPTGRAKLERKVLNRQSLLLSFNYSEDRVDFKEYIDQPIDYDFLNLDDANDDEESDNGESLWGSDDSDNYDSDESLTNGYFENEQTIHQFIRNVFHNIKNEGEFSGRRRIAESENASDDTTDSNTSDTDDTSGENVADMMRRRLNDVRVNRQMQRALFGDELARSENLLRDNIHRVINVVQDALNASDTEDASIVPNSDEDDNDCTVQ